MALFAYLPIFAGGYAWLWWFRHIFFYRDPERVIAAGDDLVVAPADGRVMYVNQVLSGEVVSTKKDVAIRVSELAKTDVGDANGWLIGIYMTPFDVHFNRAPISGKIETVHHHKTGSNLPMVDLWEYVSFTLLRKAVDMFAAPFHLENERLTMQIHGNSLSCVVILIADRFVNKITRLFDDGQLIEKGEKMTFIERGSQTDLFIPLESVVWLVEPGDHVYAGGTVLARLER